jgi:Uma2 family endonuclease
MSALLDNPAFRQRVARMSIDRYHRLTEDAVIPQNTELLRGYVFTKMSKSPLHCSLARRLQHLLQNLLPEGMLVWRDDPLTLRDSEPEPDVAVVAGRDEDFREKHPSSALLVAEVSVSTLSEDREMASIYAEAGIPEYWIILAKEKRVEVYRKPSGSAYQEVFSAKQGDSIIVSSIAGATIQVSELFQ